MIHIRTKELNFGTENFQGAHANKIRPRIEFPGEKIPFYSFTFTSFLFFYFYFFSILLLLLLFYPFIALDYFLKIFLLSQFYYFQIFTIYAKFFLLFRLFRFFPIFLRFFYYFFPSHFDEIFVMIALKE